MQSDDLLGAVHDAIYEACVKLGADELAAIAETQARCRQLQRDFGGRDHYLPALKKHTRHQQIAADLRAGVPPAEVAAKHGVHPKTVAKIAAKRSADDPGLGTKDWVL